jgi:circadian clock protein KaiB
MNSVPTPAIPQYQSNQENAANFMLRLYIVGQSPKSQAAISNLQQFVGEYISDRCHIEITDVLVNPELAISDNIIATPTLVRRHPLPMRKIIGDLSDTNKVLQILSL